MAEQGGIGVKAVLERGAQQAASQLSPDQLSSLAGGLRELHEQESLLCSIVQRGVYSSRLLRQVVRTDRSAEDSVLIRDIVQSELRHLGEDAKVTIAAIEKSRVLPVIEALRESLPNLGASLPQEDVELLGLLGGEPPELAIALALARAKRDLSAQHSRRMVERLGPDADKQPLVPIPAVEPFQHAPRYIEEASTKIDESLVREGWKPWKGIFKVIEGTVLGAANLAFALSAAGNPALALAVVTSVAGSIGAFGEGIDELRKRPVAPPARPPEPRRARPVVA